MADILKGAPVAAALDAGTAEIAAALREKGVTPTLAVLRVGERDDDLSYERGIRKKAETLGITVDTLAQPENVGTEKLLRVVARLNADARIHGILVFHPLPAGLDDKAVREAVVPEKDVDGTSSASLTGVFTGSGEGFAPCTAQAVAEIVDHYGVPCAGKSAVVVGRSLVVGRPAAMLLLQRNATVTLCHSRSGDIGRYTKDADLVVVCSGQARSVGAAQLGTGQTVIDVGIHALEDGLCGDVDFASAESVAGAITPVPGGVGSVTTSVLLRHVAEAAIRQQKEEKA